MSVAWRHPELTGYTPPADVELLLSGRCKCIPGVPVTPQGIPTPALIAMLALRLANILALVANGGLKINPYVLFFDLGRRLGRDIRTGKAVDDVEEVMQRARHACYFLLRARVYMFDETPAISPPTASFEIAPSFFKIPGLA